VDRQGDRLKLAAALDATPVNDAEGDAVQQILDVTGGQGTDKGVEAVATRPMTIRGTRSRA
jgi:glutathione-independent formaldehyde dehydrogenase